MELYSLEKTSCPFEDVGLDTGQGIKRVYVSGMLRSSFSKNDGSQAYTLQQEFGKMLSGKPDHFKRERPKDTDTGVFQPK